MKTTVPADARSDFGGRSRPDDEAPDERELPRRGAQLTSYACISSIRVDLLLCLPTAAVHGIDGRAAGRPISGSDAPSIQCLLAMVKCRIIFCDVLISISLGGCDEHPRRQRQNARCRTSSPPRTPSGRLADEATRVDDRARLDWYEQHGSADDSRGADALPAPAREGRRDGAARRRATKPCAACSSRRAGCALWIASRAISYMDENGFPEAVEPWFDEREPALESQRSRRQRSRPSGRKAASARYGASAWRPVL